MNQTLDIAKRLEKRAVVSLPTQAEVLLDAAKELRRLDTLINTPETETFLDGLKLEAAHQEERWGADCDEGKTHADWFWLVGYLAGKALAAAVLGDIEKAKHHTISTAAALANWHRKLCGSGTMRPGIIVEQICTESYQEGVKAYKAGESQLSNPYTHPKVAWQADGWIRGYHAAARDDTKENG